MRHNEEIPQEDKDKIKQIVNLNASNPIWMGVDWQYLATIFYTYHRLPSRFDTVQDAVNKAMTCGGCKSQIRAYFRTHSQTW